MNTKEMNSLGTSASSLVELDEDDAPEISADDLAKRKVTWRINRRKVSSRKGRDAMRLALRGKSRINIHLDNDVVAYFRDQAGGSGYQTLINAALRSLVESQGIKQEIERVIRESIRQEFDALKNRVQVTLAGSVAGRTTLVPSTLTSAVQKHFDDHLLGHASTSRSINIDSWMH